MGLGIGGLALIAAGLLLGARLLLRAPKNATGLGQDTPSVVATRGSWIPNYYGTRKTEQVLVGWVGNRAIGKERVSGGGKGGGSAPKTTVFFESVWHIISIDTPMTILHEIRFNGEVIWRGPINSSNTPSGTLVSAGRWGNFRIYWGEDIQPVDPILSAGIGVQSAFPGLTYLVWRPMRLGSSPAHPQVEIVGSFKCEGVTLQDSPLVLNDEEEGSTGINPAHIIHSILTSKGFSGIGLELEEVDNDSLEALGVLCETEHLPFNMSVNSGPLAARTMQAILQDLGVAMPRVDGRLTFVPARFQPASELITLGDDVIIPPDLSREIDRFPDGTANPVFVIENEANFNFRDRDVVYSDDGDNTQIGLANAERVKLETVTNLDVAARVLNRRWQESTVRSDISVSVLREARLLSPGVPFIRPGFGRVRVISSLWSAESPEVALGLTMDSYSFPTIDDAISAGFQPSLPLPPAPDIVFRPLELPGSDPIQVVVLRVRAHDGIAGASVEVSGSSSGPFTPLGAQDFSGAGGVLEEVLLDTGRPTLPAPIAVGPKFEPFNDDISGVLDLSDDETSWRGGRQIMVINDEVFFVRSFEIVDEGTAWAATTAYTIGDTIEPTTPNGLRYRCVAGGTSDAVEPSWPLTVGDTIEDDSVTWEARRKAWRPLEMLGEEYGSSAESHAVDDEALIADTIELEPISSDIFFESAATVWFKSIPRTGALDVDPADVTPVSLTLS
jgi:hypothetical protein